MKAVLTSHWRCEEVGSIPTAPTILLRYVVVVATESLKLLVLVRFQVSQPVWETYTNRCISRTAREGWTWAIAWMCNRKSIHQDLFLAQKSIVTTPQTFIGVWWQRLSIRFGNEIMQVRVLSLRPLLLRYVVVVATESLKLLVLVRFQVSQPFLLRYSVKVAQPDC